MSPQNPPNGHHVSGGSADRSGEREIFSSKSHRSFGVVSKDIEVSSNLAESKNYPLSTETEQGSGDPLAASNGHGITPDNVTPAAQQISPMDAGPSMGNPV